MRHLTLNYISNLVAERPKLDNRRPDPMPGKSWPTRVAWHLRVFEHYSKVINPNFPNSGPKWLIKYDHPKTLSYMGKPNRYRALQAHVLLNRSGVLIDSGYLAEFDKAGLVAYVLYRGGGSAPEAQACGAFYAYHPHSARPDILEAFTKPLHLKYVGGMRLYSAKKKLQQEAIDAYYEWYLKTFGRKLKRPKTAPAMSTGEENAQIQTTPNTPPEGNS